MKQNTSRALRRESNRRYAGKDYAKLWRHRVHHNFRVNNTNYRWTEHGLRQYLREQEVEDWLD